MTQPTQQASLQEQNVRADAAKLSRVTLRKRLLDARRHADAVERDQWNQQLSRSVLNWCHAHQPASLGLFWPIQAEPDLTNCYPLLHAMGIRLALPVVVGKEQPLLFIAWQPGDLMAQDDYGIPIPAQRHQIVEPEGLIIPCVGFNSENFRLGYGGGFYDRTLASFPRPKTVGIAYRLSKAEFDADTHDVPLDVILTEPE